MCDELQYTELLRGLLRKYDAGGVRETRDGARTVSCFGEQMRFDLSDNKLPLLTTKKVWYRAVLEELLWFMRGSTDTSELKEKGINIWNGHSSRKWLDAVGLSHVPEGHIGRGYGAQWRRVEGNDQLTEALRKLREDPFSRRNVVCAWNPSELSEMALPPCHMSFQFYVDDDGKGLRLHLYQRSADVGLGLPFNIASYATLAHIMAAMSGLEARELVMSFGDVHIYEGHVETLRVQAMREPLALTPFRLRIKNVWPTFEEYASDDFEVVEISESANVMSMGHKIKMPLII